LFGPTGRGIVGGRRSRVVPVASTRFGATPAQQEAVIPQSRSALSAGLALICVAALSCGDSPTDLPPAVAAVTVSPASAFLDLADTLRLSATATGPGGGIVVDEGLTWRSDSDRATVDPTGLVTGVAPGVVRIEAVASNGVVGSAQVRVTPVAAIEPDTGRYGQVVTVRGILPAGATVYFSGAGGEWERAHTRQAGPDALEVWVPVGAADGPLRLTWPGDSAVTRRHFGLAAPEDVYAGRSDPVELPFPFHNPSLLAGGGAPHAFRFHIPQATPFSLHLVDRGSPSDETTVRAWLFRVDPGPTTLVSFVMTLDNLGIGAALDSVAYSRTALPAGEYVILVAALDLESAENTAVRRAFGIRLSATASFGLAPDAYEPNDFPAEAQVVGLPFRETGLHAENPFAMDHYTFDIADESTITLATSAADPWLLLYLLPAEPVDILAAWEDDRVLAEATGDELDQQITATVPAGRYTALIWDWAARARPYDLEITAAPAASAAAHDGPVSPDRAGQADRPARASPARGAAASSARGPAGLAREAAATRRPRR
jgi:hypothetical protein